MFQNSKWLEDVRWSPGIPGRLDSRNRSVLNGDRTYRAEPYFSFRRDEKCSRKSNWCKLGRNLFYRPEPLSEGCLKPKTIYFLRRKFSQLQKFIANNLNSIRVVSFGHPIGRTIQFGIDKHVLRTLIYLVEPTMDWVLLLLLT